VQICLASRNQVKLVRDAGSVQADVEAIVSRISSSYPGTIFYELREGISTGTRMLLWQHSEVAVFSAVREAVNVWPLEYALTRSFAKVPAGVLVLSEFSGFSRVLNGALRVNPFNVRQLSENLDNALELPAAEREARAKKDLAHIHTNTSEDWGRRFLVDLKSMKRNQEEHWMAVGFGLASFRMVGMGMNFKALDTQHALITYRQSAHRAILLDWGGTLTPADTGFYDERDAEKYEVAESVYVVLKALCADPNNHVMILSGLSRDKVQSAFGSITNLSLAAEHGFHFRIKGGPWQQLLPGLDTSWRDVAEAIVKVYTTRTSGSLLQTKGGSIVWNYQHADPEFGAMQARELQYHLQGVLTAFPVNVRVGKGYVEVCPKGINKGVMAERALEIAVNGEAHDASATPTPLDFIMCLGDDSSDELMFQVPLSNARMQLPRRARSPVPSVCVRHPRLRPSPAIVLLTWPPPHVAGRRCTLNMASTRRTLRYSRVPSAESRRRRPCTSATTPKSSSSSACSHRRTAPTLASSPRWAISSSSVPIWPRRPHHSGAPAVQSAPSARRARA
jgi:trehalose 6-phosphate synthase/phosphatase